MMKFTWMKCVMIMIRLPRLYSTGVPTFFINGFVVSGAQSYEVFADAIDSALAEATSNQN